MTRGLLIVAATLGLVACAAEEQRPQGDGWVAATRRAHVEADRAIAAEDWHRARAVLEEAFVSSPPAGIDAEGRQAVRQDLAWRLAELELATERPEEALGWTERGLSLGRGEDVFTANLLIARGSAKEALGRDREAADDWWEALQINETLLRRTLGEDE